MGQITKECHYDQREAFKREVAPLVDQLFDACEKYKLPCIIAVQYASDNERHLTGVTFHAPKGKSIAPELLAMYMAQAETNIAIGPDATEEDRERIFEKCPLIHAAVFYSQMAEEESPAIPMDGKLTA